MACVLETALVTLQIWRGVPSHFNLETAFDAWVARALAAGGIALVVLIVAFTTAAFRANPGVPSSMLSAIRTGFVILIGALVVGALMIARGMLLVFQGEPQAAYATGGALKPTHAVAMHGILALPALAWLLSFTDWSEQRRLQVVRAGAAGYAVFAGAIAVGNFGWFDLKPMSFTAVALLGALSACATGLLVVRGVAPRRNADGTAHRSQKHRIVAR